MKLNNTLQLSFIMSFALFLSGCQGDAPVDGNCLTEDKYVLIYVQNSDMDNLFCANSKFANIGAVDVGNSSTLHYAATLQDSEIASWLIRNGLDVNAQNNSGKSPLHLAVEYNRFKNAKLLIENHANLELQNQFGDTPLHIATLKSYYDIAILLLDNKADPNTKNQYNGYTALHIATEQNSLEEVYYLIKNGANIDEKDKSGETPLIIASKFGWTDIVKVLLDNDADIDARDNYGRTALHMADEKNFPDISDMLIDAGIHVDVRDTIMGYTPLHWAIRENNFEIVKHLEKVGANFTLVDNNNWNIFHISAYYGSDIEILEYLLKNYADTKKVNLNAKTKEGKTPLTLVSESTHNHQQEMIALIKAHGGV